MFDVKFISSLFDGMSNGHVNRMIFPKSYKRIMNEFFYPGRITYGNIPVSWRNQSHISRKQGVYLTFLW